ncbi:LytS/YhcK type 5TM receptor domain-containing protein [Neobacillus sp. PS3-34]|uniref:LytS/YhcK type 5TM receptor domain-containing protein n=1 Tax=Neobacillus sp. PS3-34 TaxID=3070678 RepID=UPI0035A6BA50
MTRQLFFNLSIILVFLFFLQLRLDRKVNAKASKFLLFSYFSAAVFLCMLLSVETNSDIRFDLRQVPIIVGTLYLGWWRFFFLRCYDHLSCLLRN